MAGTGRDRERLRDERELREAARVLAHLRGLTLEDAAQALKDHAVLVKRATRGTPVDPANARLIPVVPVVGKTTRFDASCSDSTASADSPVTVRRSTCRRQRSG